MESTWANRDLPVLRALVEAFDDPERYRMSLDELEERTGLSKDDVKRATRALNEADPPLIKGIGADQVTYPLVIVGVTERARVRAGQWPSPEGLVEALSEALERGADGSGDPQERTRLKTVADGLRGAGREIAIRVISSYGGEVLGA